MRKPKLPWLDYTGQTTEELLACKTSHRIDSLLCAFEYAIQAKLAAQGDQGITAEEELVLAVRALDREVNNGGDHQFFVNSSRRFAPIIVSCLRRIHCDATAAIAERAIAALSLPTLSVEAIAATIYAKDPDDTVLNACDQEFYHLYEIAPKLFAFVEEHQSQFQLVRRSVPPRQPKPELGRASKLYVHLICSKGELGLDGARQLAQEYARQESIPATEAEIEGAVVQYAFRGALYARDLASCELLAPRLFELMHEDTTHCVLHRQWVEQLLEASNHEAADASTLRYLEYLGGRDQSTLNTQNRILFWATLLKKHRTTLPRSVEFFGEAFPEDDLDKPLPSQRRTALERPATRVSSPKPKEG
jgi:hypothetical protein